MKIGILNKFLALIGVGIVFTFMLYACCDEEDKPYLVVETVDPRIGFFMYKNEDKVLYDTRDSLPPDTMQVDPYIEGHFTAYQPNNSGFGILKSAHATQPCPEKGGGGLKHALTDFRVEIRGDTTYDITDKVLLTEVSIGGLPVSSWLDSNRNKFPRSVKIPKLNIKDSVHQVYLQCSFENNQTFVGTTDTFIWKKN